MSSIAKTLLTLSAGAGIITSGIIAKKHPEVFNLLPKNHIQSISPIVLYQDGTVRFIERTPSATVAAEIMAAARNQNAESLNAQLLKHRFYVVPENFKSPKSR